MVGNGCSQGGFQNFTGVLERTKTILRKSEGQFWGVEYEWKKDILFWRVRSETVSSRVTPKSTYDDFTVRTAVRWLAFGYSESHANRCMKLIMLWNSSSNVQVRRMSIIGIQDYLAYFSCNGTLENRIFSDWP